MSPQITTFLFEAANFLVLAAVLAWLFFTPVRAAIERRRKAIQEQVAEAEQKLAEVEQMRSDLKQRFADLDKELDELREQSRAASEQQAEQIVSTARARARTEADIAKRRLVHLEQSERQRLARVIAQATGASVDRLLRQLDQPELNHALTLAACREIKSFGGNSLAPVRVESAHPLNEADRKALLESLGQAGETAEFHVIADLGAGLRVATSRGLVDVSSVGLSTFAEHLIASQLTSNSDQIAEESADE